MQNLTDDLMSLDTSGEFMKQWETAYPGIRAEVPMDLAWSVPAIIDYLTVVLGNLYMRRMISIDDMRAVALEAVRAYVQWACISFGIGLEAGLGRLEDGDMQTCLYVGNQQYVSLLIGLLQPLVECGPINSLRKPSIEWELNGLVRNVSILLANAGYASHDRLRERSAGSKSPVFELVQSIDMPLVRQTMQGVAAYGD